jgi:hypothetical protein
MLWVDRYRNAAADPGRELMDSMLCLYEARAYSGAGSWPNTGDDPTISSAAPPAAPGIPTYTAESGSNPAYWTLDGVNDYAAITNHAAFNFSNTDICVWLMVVSNVTASGILWAQDGNGTTSAYNISPHAARIGSAGNTVDAVIPGSTPDTIIVTKANGGATVMYHNGASVDTGTAESSNKNSSAPMHIGKRVLGAPFWGGRLYVVGYDKGTMWSAGDVVDVHNHVTSGGLLD